ncbi:MAG: periplasmic heavy metal sensor [Candidatus Omnitrophota bacterium]
MKSKLAKIVAVLTVVGFIAAGPMAYAEFDGDNPGNNPGDNPGNNPGDNPGNNLGDNPGDNPGNNPGDNPGNNPGDNPGNNPGDNPGNNPGDNPGNNPGNGQGYQRGGGQGPMQGPLEELNLTPEQKEKFMEQQDPAKMESNKARMEQLKTKMEALNATVAEPGTARADVSDLIDEVSALQAQMLSQRMDHLFAMKELLTPEQFAKMQEMEKQRMKKGPGGLGEKNQGPNQN